MRLMTQETDHLCVRGSESSRAHKDKEHMKKAEARAAWLFMSPDLIGLGIFVVFPIILALALSLFRVSGFGGITYIGLENFQRLAVDPKLPKALLVTFLYAFCFVPIAYIVGLALALLVEKPFPGSGIVRTLFFVPYVLSLVVVGFIWQFLVTDKTGLIPTMLRPFGLGNISWLGDPKFALATVVIISVWSQAGYQMLILLGGLGSIPQEYYDAASIDGAGKWYTLRHITLPLLRPTTFFVLLTSAMGAITGMQAFDLVFILTSGGPADATLTMPFYIYEQAFTYNDLGYASALTVLLVSVLVVAVAISFHLTKGAKFHEG